MAKKATSQYARNRQPSKVQMDYDRLRSIAADYFLYGILNQKQIAEKLGVNEDTIGRWKKEDGWDEAKKDNRLNLAKIANNVINKASQIAEKLESAEDIKDLKELTNILKEFRPHDTLTDLVNAFSQFINWLTRMGYEREALQFYELQDEFLIEFIEKKA